jgi:hypothetical protein
MLEGDAFGLESRERLVKPPCCFSVGARASVIHDGKPRLVGCTSHQPPAIWMFAVDDQPFERVLTSISGLRGCDFDMQHTGISDKLLRYGTHGYLAACDTRM